MPVWEEDDEDDHGAREQLNNGMRNFMAYIEYNLVGQETKKTCGARGSHLDLPGSCGTTTLGSEVTNNHSESYNSSYKASLPSKPSTWCRGHQSSINFFYFPVQYSRLLFLPQQLFLANLPNPTP